LFIQRRQEFENTIGGRREAPIYVPTHARPPPLWFRAVLPKLGVQGLLVNCVDV
jgi:hypothetical protein